MTMQTDAEMNSYVNFDFRMEWSLAARAGSTVIGGYLRNSRYALMENIEVWVMLLDVKGRKLCRAADFVSSRLARDEQASFSITLPAIAVPGCRLAFTCKYHGDETTWQQTFETPADSATP